MGTRAAWFLTGHWAGLVLMTASVTPNSLFSPCTRSHEWHLDSVTKGRGLLAWALFVAQLDMTNCVYGAFKGVVLVEADSTDQESSLWWTRIYSLLSSLSIHIATLCADHHRHSTRVQAVQRHGCLEVCMPPQESPGLGHLQRGGCWELGCVLDQGLNFPLKMRKKVYGTLPWECLLLFEAPASVAALILGKDYFISLFLSLSSLLRLSLSLSITSGFVWISSEILSLPLPPSLCSFHTAPFLGYTHSSAPALCPFLS